MHLGYIAFMPEISIAIPSKNGGDYLPFAIESVLSQDNLDFELLVSIDGTQAEVDQITSRYDHPNLKVSLLENSLSMAAHYEWCLNQLSGKWQTILGQDDALLPNFSETVNGLLHTSCEAISFRRSYFFWPGCEDTYGHKAIDFSFEPKVSIKQSEKEIYKALKGTVQHYDLPQIYTNNLVKSEVLQRIRKNSRGKIFHEMTPDVYSGVAVALASGSWLRVETPVFWTGTSPSSAGLAISKSVRPSDSKVAESIKSEHLSLAESEGIGVSPSIGKELWFAANVSPIMTISALDSCPYADSEWGKRKYLVTAISSTYSMAFLQSLPGFFKVLDSKKTKKLLYRLVKQKKLNRIQIYLMSFISAGAQIRSSAVRILSQRLFFRNRLRISYREVPKMNIIQASVKVDAWLKQIK